MPFNICDDGCRISHKPRKLHAVRFATPDLVNCIAFTNTFPGEITLPIPYFGRKERGEEWEIEVVKDVDFSYRQVFERWLNGINCGVYRTEMATVERHSKIGDIEETKKTLPLLPVNISPIDMSWDSNGVELTNFIVRFLVNPTDDTL